MTRKKIKMVGANFYLVVPRSLREPWRLLSVMEVVDKFAEPTISPEQLRKQQQQKLATNKKQILWEDSFRKWTHKIAKKDLTTESH